MQLFSSLVKKSLFERRKVHNADRPWGFTLGLKVTVRGKDTRRKGYEGAGLLDELKEERQGRAVDKKTFPITGEEARKRSGFTELYLQNVMQFQKEISQKTGKVDEMGNPLTAALALRCSPYHQKEGLFAFKSLLVKGKSAKKDSQIEKGMLPLVGTKNASGVRDFAYEKDKTVAVERGTVMHLTLAELARRIEKEGYTLYLEEEYPSRIGFRLPGNESLHFIELQAMETGNSSQIAAKAQTGAIQSDREQLKEKFLKLVNNRTITIPAQNEGDDESIQSIEEAIKSGDFVDFENTAFPCQYLDENDEPDFVVVAAGVDSVVGNTPMTPDADPLFLGFPPSITDPESPHDSGIERISAISSNLPAEQAVLQTGMNTLGNNLGLNDSTFITDGAGSDNQLYYGTVHPFEQLFIISVNLQHKVDLFLKYIASPKAGSPEEEAFNYFKGCLQAYKADMRAYIADCQRFEELEREPPESDSKEAIEYEHLGYVMTYMNQRDYNIMQNGCEARSPMQEPEDISQAPILHVWKGEYTLTENEEELIDFILQPGYLENNQVPVHPKWIERNPRWLDVIDAQQKLGHHIKKPAPWVGRTGSAFLNSPKSPSFNSTPSFTKHRENQEARSTLLQPEKPPKPPPKPS